MTDFDPSVFGLPTDMNGQPGFMYAESDLAVDENDPIYQQVKVAMDTDAAARGVPPTPAPADQPRPPVMSMKEGEDAATDPPTPPAGDPAADVPGTPPTIPGTPPTIPGTDDGSTPPTEVTPGQFTFKVDEQEVTLTAEQAEYLLRVNSWLESIPQETQAAWSGIEQGTHVAVPAEELVRLRAAAQLVQKPAVATPPPPPDIDSLDDETIAYIRSLESRVPAATQPPTTDQPFQQQPAQGQPSTAEIAAAAQRQAIRAAQMQQELAQLNATWQEQWGLDDAQMERLGQVTSNLQIVPRLSQQATQYSPTGQVLREADFGQVVATAYEMAMNADPTLRAIRDEVIYNRRMVAEQQRNTVTDAKKARAGSLASAPSAAVPASGAAPKIGPDNKMNLQETSNAIAKALAEMAQNP